MASIDKVYELKFKNAVVVKRVIDAIVKKAEIGEYETYSRASSDCILIYIHGGHLAAGSGMPSNIYFTVQYKSGKIPDIPVNEETTHLEVSGEHITPEIVEQVRQELSGSG